MAGAAGPDDIAEGLLHIGTVVKPHGIRGEVVVQPVTNRPERFEAGAVHHAAEQTLVVVRTRRHQGRWIVSYEGCADRTTAESLRGTVLAAEPLDVDDDSELWAHELVGSQVVDVGGVVRGRVVAVEVNPAHDILVLDTGALVPVVFVTDVGDGEIRVDVPEGLFDEEFVAPNRVALESAGRRRPRPARPPRRRDRGR